ncbi:MAG TPA: glycosyltransferase, partial [Pyrinomonadaceae bacterium]|nr:glycosyltransferase [Pyrinomonadaceae bacterium]
MPRHSLDATLERLRRWNRWYEGGSAPEGGGAAGGVRGVNVWGYLRDESGWGEAGRGYVRALRRLGVPLALLNVSELSSNRSEDRTLEGFDTSHPFDVNLVCVDAGQHFAMMHRVGEEFFEGRYNVGAWAWELPRFPARLYDRFAYYDEIWVGTSFIADALAPVSPVPVVRVPPVLTARAEGSRERGRARVGVSEDEFVFLFVFDFHSHLARKNPLALVDAFRLAFAPEEPARLVVKCVNGRADPEGFARLCARAGGHSVEIHDGYWTGEEMRDLFEACDAYASLHRSEGTGLTLSEAMARGKPVVGTGWSGNTDFMNVSNSFPVRFRLTEIEETVGPYEAGETWAEPSVEHAAQLMRHVYERRDEAAVVEVEGAHLASEVREALAPGD